MGDTLIAQKKIDEGIASYHEALALGDKLIALDPRNQIGRATLQILLVKLGLAGEDTQQRLDRGAEILKKRETKENSQSRPSLDRNRRYQQGNF